MRMLTRLFACWAFLLLPAAAQRLTPLAAKPDWSRLEAFQETMTRAEFQRLLDTVYAPGGAAAGVIEVRETEAIVYKTLVPAEPMTLRFAPEGKAVKPPQTYWRVRAKLPAVSVKKPLAGLRLALDAGHLGGAWGLMEERSFARPGDAAVQEGDMTLLVVKRVAAEARRLGAKVSLVRDKAGPIAPFKVEAFYPAAEKELALMGIDEVRQKYETPRDPLKMHTVQWQAEKLFYRVAEIHERARKVNRTLKPDLLVCVHFNADDWHDPVAPVFTPRNDLHVLVHGCYSTGELRFDDQRCEMLVKLLNRSHVAELGAARPMAEALAKTTGLPAFTYFTGNASKVVAQNEFIWARNLLANRLYECPVIFLEPYRMNHEEVYARIQAGDYEGEREVAGKMRMSIFREYAEGIIAGLKAWRAAK
jgi:hypothetical protein